MVKKCLWTPPNELYNATIILQEFINFEKMFLPAYTCNIQKWFKYVSRQSSYIQRDTKVSMAMYVWQYFFVFGVVITGIWKQRRVIQHSHYYYHHWNRRVEGFLKLLSQPQWNCNSIHNWYGCQDKRALREWNCWLVGKNRLWPATYMTWNGLWYLKKSC